MKILFFIGTLSSGGKERRIIELMPGLNNNSDFEILLVLAFNQIDYEYFYELGINYIVINKKPNSKSIKVFFQLDKIVKDFNPDIIHTWGSMQTFYMLPSSILRKISLINSQITDAPLRTTKRPLFQRIINNVNFRFSTINLANSYAGLESYGIENKRNSRVIHNGFNMKRIASLEPVNSTRKKFNISTKYIVAMVASFSDKKDYKTYIEAALQVVSARDEVTFLCVGAGDDTKYREIVPAKFKHFIKFLGRQENVESIMNIVDIGVLSTYTEGISNAIMEFMALGKPIIATDGGGTKELVIDGETGFLIEQRNIEELTEKILHLINDKDLRKRLGEKGYDRIISEFLIDKMTDSFLKLYDDIIRES